MVCGDIMKTLNSSGVSEAAWEENVDGKREENAAVAAM